MLAAAGAAAAARAESLPVPTIDPASGIEISLRTPFDPLPPTGACTVEVAIRNGSRRDGHWDLRLGTRPFFGWSQTTTESVTVEAGASRAFVIVSFMSPTSSYGYGVSLRMEGPGVASVDVPACAGRADLFTHDRHASPLAMSRSLFGSGGRLNLLREELQKQGRSFAASSFLPADLPAETRSYSPFTLMFLRDDEWRGLPADVREAIDGWVSLGGHLWLLGPPTSDTPRGFGRISTAPLLANGEPDWELVAQQALADTPWELVTGATHGGWELLKQLPAPEAPRGLLFGLLATVSVLMGPVNLFWFARGRLRHRVYWTTPLIAALAALALLVMILVRDGTGGTGHRWTAIALVPGAHRAAIVQEQAARTGLLLDNRFRSSDPLRAVPLSLQEDWRMTGGALLRLEDSGDAHSGWFASRRTLGHYVETTRPTRARVEARFAGTPEVLSSIEGVLDEVFVLDPSGAVWHAAGVRAGQRAPLERSERYDTWLADAMRGAGPGGNQRVLPLARRPGYFYASATGPGAIETLPAIRWTQDRLLYVGPVEELR